MSHIDSAFPILLRIIQIEDEKDLRQSNATKESDSPMGVELVDRGIQEEDYNTNAIKIRRKSELIPSYVQLITSLVATLNTVLLILLVFDIPSYYLCYKMKRIMSINPYRRYISISYTPFSLYLYLSSAYHSRIRITTRGHYLVLIPLFGNPLLCFLG